MKRMRFYGLLLVLAAFVTTGWAQKVKYHLWVGGEQVTSNNYSNVSGSNIIQGKVSYDPVDNILTLTNARIVCAQKGVEGITSSMGDLDINIVGTCEIWAYECAALRFNKTGAVNIKSGAKLTLYTYDSPCIYLDGGSTTHLTLKGTGALEMRPSEWDKYTAMGVRGKNGTERLTFDGPVVLTTTTNGSLWDLGQVHFKGGDITLSTTYEGYMQVHRTSLKFSNNYHISYPLGARFNSERSNIDFMPGTPYYGSYGSVGYQPAYTHAYQIRINTDFKAKVDASYFPHANFRNYISQEFDLNKDGYISTCEIEDPKVSQEINVASKLISNFEGVQYFKNITYLDCSDNNPQKLDVSQNRKLRTLYCNANALPALDVSNNEELTLLHCAYNRLKSLDVSRNTKLKTLYCHANAINMTEMQALINSLPKTTGGKLYAIDQTYTYEKNVITKAQVEQAKQKGWTVYDWNGGKAKTYAGSENLIPINDTNFPDAYFRAFVKNNYDKDSDNYLSETEIAKVKNLSPMSQSISNLTGMEHFTAMTKLNCVSNNLTTLKVVGLPVLQTLFCDNNKLTTLNVVACEELDDLTCRNNQLKELHIFNNTKLIRLSCANNLITELSLYSNKALEQLHCSKNQLTKLNISENTKLQSLGCDNNRLTALDISKNKALTSIICHGNAIRGTAMQTLVDNLPTVTEGTLEVMDMDNKNEQNVITKRQVAVAKKKGWRVIMWKHGYRRDYEGSEDYDLNGDGAVDVGDVTTLVAAVLSGNAPATFDLNGDNAVDVGDVTLLVSAVLSGK